MTQQKSSKPKLNAGQIVGDFIDRFRRQAGWNLADEQTPEAKNDRKQLILVFLEVLGVSGAPVEYYDKLYQLAMATRAKAKSDGKSVPFHITAEEVAAEWFALERKLRDKESDKPAELCGFRANHEEGEPIVTYFPYGEPMVLPCHECRPEAHRIRKAEKIEARNKSFANRRLKAAPEQPKEDLRPDKPLEAVKAAPVAESCRNCGQVIAGKYRVLSPDFLICEPCDKQIQELREQENT